MLYDEEGPELSADFGNRYVKVRSLAAAMARCSLHNRQRLFGRITFVALATGRCVSRLVQLPLGCFALDRYVGRRTILFAYPAIQDYGWENTKPCPNESLKDGTAERWIQKQVRLHAIQRLDFSLIACAGHHGDAV
jgi:hypothetical protein